MLILKLRKSATIILLSQLLTTGCAQYSKKHLVNFPPIEPAQPSHPPTVIDLRPDDEKNRVHFGGGIEQISDQRFSVAKITYLKIKLGEKTKIKSAKLVKFQHILDLSQSLATSQAVAIESALSATQNMYWHRVTRPKGANSVHCNLQIIADGKTYTGSAEAFFPYQVYWFSPYERDDIKDLLVQVTNEAINEIVSEIRQ